MWCVKIFFFFMLNPETDVSMLLTQAISKCILDMGFRFRAAFGRSAHLSRRASVRGTPAKARVHMKNDSDQWIANC